MGLLHCSPMAFAGSAVRRMVAAGGRNKTGTGGLFEARLGAMADPWVHRVSVYGPGEAQKRAMVNAKWFFGAGKQNGLKMAPWGAVGLVGGYFFIQNALPDWARII